MAISTVGASGSCKGIHDYLDDNLLTLIFFKIVEENPVLLLPCASVCKKWKSLTEANHLWSALAQRMEVGHRESDLYLRATLAQLLRHSFEAIRIIQVEQLLEENEPRRWVLVALENKVRRYERHVGPEGTIDPEEREQAKRVLNEAKKAKEQKISKLSDGFWGHVYLSRIGLSHLDEAKKIATLLASDKYFNKNPIEKLYKMGHH